MKYYASLFLNWLGSLDHPRLIGFMTLSAIPFSQWPDAAQRTMHQFR